jgi:hypothetical protein
MPVNRDLIGSKKWINSLKHQSKLVLIQLADVDFDEKEKYTKEQLIEIYKIKLCKENQ